jgi:hypothetical protein
MNGYRHSDQSVEPTAVVRSCAAAVALILGASLRFRHLTMADLDADEGFTWAAAIAPSFGAVAAEEQRLEASGKLSLNLFNAACLDR